MPFELKRGKKKSSLILKGSADISEVKDMQNALKESLNSDIEVDMNSASSVDFSILQLLIAAKAALKREGRSFVIKSKSEDAKKVIKLAGAMEVL